MFGVIILKMWCVVALSVLFKNASIYLLSSIIFYSILYFLSLSDYLCSFFKKKKMFFFSSSFWILCETVYLNFNSAFNNYPK